ncbi:ComEC/Rec2 family competence protein [Salsuginibacillus kocurii]|uniref:ComEC/Rec2 family competence protein n=1 Tax=Salsuginibacillus kocurii TaxID=427078 RepID=UPI000376C726|nr:MBL fold metallo-hydrolase [Salsuginibacillus kocurii]
MKITHLLVPGAAFLTLMLAGCETEEDAEPEAEPESEEEADEQAGQKEPEEENEEEPATTETETDEEEVQAEEEEKEQIEEEEQQAAGEELDELAVHFIDAGQADATLFEVEEEEETYKVLFDAGDWSRADVVDYLHEQDIEEIDILAGSHPHADHIGQMDMIIEEFEVEEVWMSGDTTTTDTFERVIEAIETEDVAYEEPRRGDTYDVGGMEIEVVNPDELSGDLHEGSLSATFSYGEVDVLLTGDAEAETEQEMVEEDLDLSSEVLHLGHHGSDTSTIPEFLEEVAPEAAIVSAGEP